MAAAPVAEGGDLRLARTTELGLWSGVPVSLK
jgi:hypothetical protein